MKKTSTRILLSLVSTLVLGIISFLSLPFISDKYIIPNLIKNINVSNKNVSISRISPFHFRGNLSLENNDLPIISMPRIELFYSPFDLMKGKIKTLLIDHATIHLELESGKPILYGISNNSSKKDEKSKSHFSLSALPASIEAIHFKQCRFVLHNEDATQNEVTIDGVAQFLFDEKLKGKTSLSRLNLELSTHGNVKVSGAISLTETEKAYEVTSKEFRLHDISSLKRFTKISLDLLKGDLLTSIHISLDKETLAPKDIDFKAILEDFSFRKGNIHLQNEQSTPPVFHLTGSNEKLSYTIQHVSMISPVAGNLDIRGSLQFDKLLQSAGSYQFSYINAQDDVNQNIPITGQYEFTKTEPNWQAKLSASVNSELAVTISDDSVITIGKAGATLVADGNEGVTKSSLSLSFEQVKAITSKDSVVIPTVDVNGMALITGASISSQIIANIPSLQLPSQNIEVRDISLQLPLQTATESTGYPTGTGKLTLGDISLEGQSVAKFSSKLFLHEKQASIKATLSTPIQPDLSIFFSGTTDYKKNHFAEFTLQETTISSDDFAPYLPIPDMLSFDGNIESKGSFTIKGTQTSGETTIWGSNIDFSIPESDVYLSGISFQFELPELPAIRSSPSQIATIDDLEFGSLKFSDAKIHFRLEDTNSLFIEKSKLRWCGGKVESGSLRLTSGAKDLETTLYCDRLKFSELLGQFGIEDTQGAGSLNGKLPVRISEKGLYFDDGFLFSTPGESGIMHFSNTDMLKSGMPNLDQTATLSYSLQALENFSYDWSRLTFSSKEDVLTLSMQIEGKPAEPLPFGYKSGQIVNDTEGPGLQHPVRLDLNFNLPQEDIFQYGKNLQSLKENL